jgi:hypothetical protein
MISIKNIKDVVKFKGSMLPVRTRAYYLKKVLLQQYLAIVALGKKFKSNKNKFIFPPLIF